MVVWRGRLAGRTADGWWWKGGVPSLSGDGAIRMAPVANHRRMNFDPAANQRRNISPSLLADLQSRLDGEAVRGEAELGDVAVPRQRGPHSAHRRQL